MKPTHLPTPPQGLPQGAIAKRPSPWRSAQRWIIGVLLLIIAAGVARIAGALTVSLVSDLYPAGSSSPDWLTPSGGALFFSGYLPGAKAPEKFLWKTDGTAPGTVALCNPCPGGNSSIAFLTDVNGTLFFSAQDATHGQELWKSNGTPEGTAMVKDISPLAGSSFPGPLTAVGDMLFFTAWEQVHGQELWKSNGTEAGTVMVKDIRPETNFSSSPRSLTNVNGSLFFSAYSVTQGGGRELWMSNGSETGTVLVEDINPFGASDPQELANWNNVLFFSADDGAHGRELWRSDGTDPGTALVKDINPSFGPSNPRELAPLNSATLLFSADDGMHGQELWKTDGTAFGTVIVQDINPTGPSDPTGLTAVNGAMFFAADDGVHGVELWKSDGTPGTAAMVKDINLAGSSNPSYLTEAAGRLFFSADDGAHGEELWISDGTDAGTTMTRDLNPGAADGVHFGDKGGPIRCFDGSLFFAGDDGNVGRELWVARKGAPPVLNSVADNGAGAAHLTWSNPADPPEQFLGLAWDIYAQQWASRGAQGTMWYPFGPLACEGDMDLGFSGAYHVWISSLHWDGWRPAQNPWTGILYSGTPHTPTGLWAQSLSPFKIRLHWTPEIYGTWLCQIIVYKVGAGWIDTNGPSGNQLWHFVDFGGAAYDPNKASFFQGWADFNLPFPYIGTYWLFIRGVGWVGPPYSVGDYAAAPMTIGF